MERMSDGGDPELEAKQASASGSGALERASVVAW